MQGSLEESGLLYKLASCCDKPLSHLGLSGNALIPMLLGFGCTTVALAAVQILPSKRERLIASVILSIIVPCSAQVAIIIALSFLLNVKYVLLYIIFITTTFFILSYTLNLLIPGIVNAPKKIIQPPLKFPNFKKILIHSVKSGINFLRETATPFVIGSIIVSLLTYTNCFAKLSLWFSPITNTFLHLPNEATSLFMLSMIKRDLGAAALLSIVKAGTFTQAEITVCLIILTLFVPCFASVVLLFRQQKPPTAISIWLGSFVISMCVGKVASLLML